MSDTVKVIDLSAPTILSHYTLPGPWQVVISHPTDPHNWYIFNTETRRYKKIGRVGAKRTNYFEQARNEAMRRNLQAAKGKYVIFSHVETQAQDDAEPMFWSNEQGWVSLPDATVFDTVEGDLPNPAGCWTQYYIAVLSFWREMTGNN